MMCVCPHLLHMQKQATSEDSHPPQRPPLHWADANGQVGQDCKDGGTAMRAM